MLCTRRLLQPRFNFQFKVSQRRFIFLSTRVTPNPESLQFLPDAPVLPDGLNSLDFGDAKSARASPLANSLFEQGGVKRVFLGPDFITVTKSDDIEWSILKPMVYASVMEFFTSGQPILNETDFEEEPGHKDTEILETDSETVAMIKELIEARVRPGLQADGGDIIYHGFVGGVVYVQLKGSCDGCPSSMGTLKHGIERMLQHWIPGTTVLNVESLEEFRRLIGEDVDNDVLKSLETELTAEENLLQVNKKAFKAVEDQTVKE